MLVLHGMLNPGALVSFMLYQQQLTSCFSAGAYTRPLFSSM